MVLRYRQKHKFPFLFSACMPFFRVVFGTGHLRPAFWVFSFQFVVFSIWVLELWTWHGIGLGAAL